MTMAEIVWADWIKPFLRTAADETRKVVELEAIAPAMFAIALSRHLDTAEGLLDKGADPISVAEASKHRCG
jgi:hypothetical protein